MLAGRIVTLRRGITNVVTEMKTPLWAEEYKRLMSGEYCEVEAKKTFGLPIDFAFPLARAAPGMPSQLPAEGSISMHFEPSLHAGLPVVSNHRLGIGCVLGVSLS